MGLSLHAYSIFRKSIASHGGIYEAGALIKKNPQLVQQGGRLWRRSRRERLEKALEKESPYSPSVYIPGVWCKVPKYGKEYYSFHMSPFYRWGQGGWASGAQLCQEVIFSKYMEADPSWMNFLVPITSISLAGICLVTRPCWLATVIDFRAED